MAFSTANGLAAEGVKRVLILNSYGHSFVPFGAVSAPFQTELAERYGGPIDFHEVSIAPQQFAASDSDRPTINYLHSLYGEHGPDLVVPFGGLAVRFALRTRTQLFPSTALLLSSVDVRHLKAVTLDSDTTAVAAQYDFPYVMGELCRVLPGTTNIAVIIGRSALEEFLKQDIKRDLSVMTNRVSFTWLDAYGFDEIQGRVAQLPPHTAIFYISMFVDAAGVPHEYGGVLNALHAKANAPIAALFEDELGSGIIGGPMLNLRQLGRESAHVAVRILNGESPGGIHLAPVTTGMPIYDWRELRRWNVNMDFLPKGSFLTFVEPTFWERHRKLVVAVLSLVMLLSIFTAGITVNLNQRRKAERSLHDSEERMKLAASAAELGMWEWDFATNKVWVDEGGRARTGAEDGENGEAQIIRFLRTVHPEDQKGVAAALATAIVGDGNYQHVHRQMQENGGVRWIAARGKVEFDVERRPVKMRGVGIDITERKLAEDRARESERQFILTANAAPVFIWASSPENKCTFCNQPWLDFRGTTMEKESGSGWQDGVHPEDLADVQKVLSEAYDARQPFTIEYRVRRHDGQYRWLIDHGVPRYDAEGQYLGFIGSCVDVTEKREAEVEARRWQSELAHVSRLSTLWELAGSLAHELRQPLAAIVNSAEAGRRFMEGKRKDEAEVRAALKDIAEQGVRAGEIITEMRAMLKKDPGEMAPHDINLIVRTVMEMVGSDLVMRHVTSKLRLDPTLPLANCHGVQLRQVVLNLVMNGWEAMAEVPAEQRRLVIESRRAAAGEIEVSVSDTGCGFSEEMLRQPFESFRTTKAKGLGLGLAICRSIITAHDGHLVLANNARGGATVKFTLPTQRRQA